jgi:hypothetical protein
MSPSEFLAWHAANLAEIRGRILDMFARLELENQIVAISNILIGGKPYG